MVAWERALLGAVVAMAALARGCHAPEAAELELVVGAEDSERVRFRPESSFAELLRLPGEHDELRVTLAGYEASCERFVPPGPGRASITVTVAFPAGVEPKPGTYSWTGHEAHGGTPARPERPYALPTARLGPRGYVFPPGGSITLSAVELSPRGRVEGLLAFSFPGDASHPAMSATGRFSARLCRADAPAPP